MKPQTNNLIKYLAVVAMAENHVIGNQQKLPWHLPADLQHFKEITSGHCILMGRKTYESIGKPLPNRINLILSNKLQLDAPGCVILNKMEDISQFAQDHRIDKIFVIGGAEIYRLFLPKIQYIYLTIVHHEFEGDTFFPELKTSDWQEVCSVRHSADEKNAYDYSFCELERLPIS